MTVGATINAGSAASIGTVSTARKNTSGGIALGVVGGLLVLGAVFTPYETKPSLAIIQFHNYTGATLWYALEPLAVGVAAIIVSMIPLSAAVRRASLITIGAQTLLMFAGYAFYPISNSYGTGAGAGGFLGILGALGIAAGGILAGRARASDSLNALLLSVVAQQPYTTPETKTCPDCAEPVNAQARVCRFCGYDFVGRTSRFGAS